MSKEIVGSFLPQLLPTATIITVVTAAVMFYDVHLLVGCVQGKLSRPARVDQANDDDAASTEILTPARNT